MQRAPLSAVGMSYSPITVPSGAMRPILLAAFSVNHRAPSAPTVIPRSEALGVGTGNSTIVPSRAMRPKQLPPVSANQMLPSEPHAIARGSLSRLGIGNSTTRPSSVIRPIRPPAASLNHSVSSPYNNRERPAASRYPLPNSVTVPFGVPISHASGFGEAGCINGLLLARPKRFELPHPEFLVRCLAELLLHVPWLCAHRAPCPLAQPKIERGSGRGSGNWDV